MKKKQRRCSISSDGQFGSIEPGCPGCGICGKMKKEMKKKIIKGKFYGRGYYVVICSDKKWTHAKDSEMICGVLASKREAEDLIKEIKGCVCRHYIKKVKEVWCSY